MDILLHDYFDVDGVEFVWATKEEVEPLKQAQIDQMYVNLHILTPSEVRSRLGYDPLTEEQTEEFAALSPPQVQLPALFSDGGSAHKTDAPPARKRDAPDTSAVQKKFAAAIRKMFDRVKPDLLRQLERSYAKAMGRAEKVDAKQKKKLMQNFCIAYRGILSKHNLSATGTTGKHAQDAGLDVERVLSGPLGGDAQIAAQVAEGKVQAVFFFKDPLDKHPHEPDINMLLRICDVHNVPIATNPATAELVLKGLVYSVEK